MRRLTGSDDGDDPSTAKVDLKQVYRDQLTSSIGGWQGMVVAGLPAVVFVAVNALAALKPAIIAAVSTGVALTIYRLVRKQSVQQAISGLFGVLIAALIAARTGEARGYFLFGIWQSFVYAVPFVISILVRRPLVGVVYEFVDPTPGDEDVRWYRRRRLLIAYTIATVIGATLFLARGFVQLALYGDNATGWLAFARLAMGYPLFILAVAAGWWVIRRARHAEAPPEKPTDGPGGTPEPNGTVEDSADDSGAQRGLGLR